ncbi:MAG: hypothetical protein E7137_08035 [Rikenellaceae bacterium]|nr:hypothetical protein [Rikenellaceae bacterium]
MKLSLFNGALVGLLLLASSPLLAGEGTGNSRPPLDRREHLGRSGWSRIIPTHLKVQYAGSMGLISVGCGWDYGRKCRWETDLLAGYVPKFEGSKGHATLTLKQNYIPWALYASDHFSFEPFYTGIYLNTILGDEFWTRQPDRYPSGYYWFSTRMRIHAFVGCRASWHPRKGSRIKGVTLFFEINSCDLYIVRKVGNHYLNASDLVGFSLGLKCQIF